MQVQHLMLLLYSLYFNFPYPTPANPTLSPPLGHVYVLYCLYLVRRLYTSVTVFNYYYVPLT